MGAGGFFSSHKCTAHERHCTCFQGLEQSEEAGRLPDARERYAEGLDFQEQILHITKDSHQALKSSLSESTDSMW